MQHDARSDRERYIGKCGTAKYLFGLDCFSFHTPADSFQTQF